MAEDDDEITRKAIEAAKRLYTADSSIRRYELNLERSIAGKNHLFVGDIDGVGRVRFLVSFPGGRGDWSLSKSGLLHLWNGVEESKIVRGIVSLRQGSVQVNGGSIALIWPKLEGAFWMDFGNGEFCWVDVNFNPATNSSGSGSRYYVTDPDAPF